MTEHVYKHIELTGSSATSMEDAIETAISRASKTMRDMHWFQVTDTRGHIDERQGRALAGHDQGGLHARRVT